MVAVARPARSTPTGSRRAPLGERRDQGLTTVLVGAASLDQVLQQRHTSERDVLDEKGFWLFLGGPVLGAGVPGFDAITDLGPGEKYVRNLPLAVAVVHPPGRYGEGRWGNNSETEGSSSRRGVLE